jgi:ubiquinone biosynthesis protein UbiJ
LLAPRPQTEAFLRAVDVLRADADRLEKRLESLAGRAA